MKEFLDNLYHQCAGPHSGKGVEAVFDVLPILLSQKKFDVINNILKDIDLSKVDTSTMYSLVSMISNYINVLSQYKLFYTQVREEFARRGDTSKRIGKLFDQFQDGGNHIYDPDKVYNISHEENYENRIDQRINQAKQANDDELVSFLERYKSYRLSPQENQNKFHNMRLNIGDKEVKKRTIKALKDMADKLETNIDGWPDVYYCDLPDDPLLKESFIDTLVVTISYPWPG